jgi:hypothetical protein
MKKKIPTFKTDEEAENFVATADLTKYDLSGARLVKFELKSKATLTNRDGQQIKTRSVTGKFS